LHKRSAPPWQSRGRAQPSAWQGGRAAITHHQPLAMRSEKSGAAAPLVSGRRVGSVPRRARQQAVRCGVVSCELVCPLSARKRGTRVAIRPHRRRTPQLVRPVGDGVAAVVDDWGLVSHPATCRGPVVGGASGRGKPASEPSERSDRREPGEPCRPDERSGPSEPGACVMPQPKNAGPLDANRAVWSCLCSRGLGSDSCRCPCTSSRAPPRVAG
jgi:hypothetical protein